MDERILTGVTGLDERLGGGIPRRSTVLVTGPTGSMKSSLVYAILHANALTSGRKSLYLSLEQPAEDLRAQIRSVGIDPKAAKDLHLVDLTDFRKEFKAEEAAVDWFDTLAAVLRRYQREAGIELVAIDSLDALMTLADPARPRQTLFHFFRDLRALGTTTFFIGELGRDGAGYSRAGIEEFLTDGIIHLRTRELERGQVTSVRRYLGVAKMRRTNHSADYFPLILNEGRFEIVTD